jgi:hypothetical protein
MATTKRSKSGRAKAAARSRAAKSAKPAPKKKTSAARPVAKAKSATKAKLATKAKSTAKPTRAATKPTRVAAKPVRAASENLELAALKSKFSRERNGLEKRLTEAVREIGILRMHELRAMQFERQVAERDATIERLQTQLGELQRRPAEPVYVHEVQQSLALGASSPLLGEVRSAAQLDLDGGSADLDHSAVDLDEFEDDRLPDDGDLVSDDD